MIGGVNHMSDDRNDPPAVFGAAAVATLPRTTAAAAGAVVAGLAAMSCCVAPLIFVFAGIGGAWIANLTALSPYQPIFIAIAVLSIGYGHLSAYRARKACAAGGAACKRTLPRWTVDAGLWTGTAMVVIALVANFAMPWLLS
jgi:mercuric ion transport protein